MTRLKSLVLAVIILLNDGCCEGRDNRISQYYGFVGCVFSRSLCRAGEECVDDGLFGSCQRSGRNLHDLYWYRLSNSQLVELEQILHHLAVFGYTWRHLYTQCRVISTLLSYRYNIQLRNDFCETGQHTTERKNMELIPEQSDGTDKLIGDLTDMLTAQISLSSREDTSAGSKHHEKWKENVHSADDYSNVVDQSPDQMFEKLLRRLPDSDLKVLKEFIVQQLDNYKERDENILDVNKSAIVKKLDPSGSGTVTKVVIHYDPETKGKGGGEHFVEPPREEIAVNEKLSPSAVDILWSVSPITGGFDLKGQSVLDSFASIETLSVHGRINEDVISTSTSAESESDKTDTEQVMLSSKEDSSGYMIALYVLCGLLVVLVITAIALVIMRHNTHLREKLIMPSAIKHRKEETTVITGDYQDLCREDMRQKLEETKPCPVFPRADGTLSEPGKSFQRSNALPWPEDNGTVAASQMDISTGHMILSYMEGHIRNKDKLEKDWKMVCSYDAEPGSIVTAIDPANMKKNRYADVLPYEQTRVRLNAGANVNSSDYINASTITDHDPHCPAYIAAQGPMQNTVMDFWQMVWEQGSATIVCLTALLENDVHVCSRYWPNDGSDLYHIYEVKLITEHEKVCDDYVVRSFCLRNIETNETRTVTQFHYLSWPSLGIPTSTKTLMEFRRKVNTSYHGRFCPIIVHCSDGAGQTGAYCLIDMVLNRLNKGAKEMDIAATLEHIRDQRANMVRTKEQFEFCLTAIAYEVGNLLHVAPRK